MDGAVPETIWYEVMVKLTDWTVILSYRAIAVIRGKYVNEDTVEKQRISNMRRGVETFKWS